MTDHEVIAFLVSNPDLPWLLDMAQRYPWQRDRFAELEQAYSALHYTFRVQAYSEERFRFYAKRAMHACDRLLAHRADKTPKDRARLLDIWRLAHRAADVRPKLHANWNEHWRRSL